MSQLTRKQRKGRCNAGEATERLVSVAAKLSGGWPRAQVLRDAMDEFGLSRRSAQLYLRRALRDPLVVLFKEIAHLNGRVKEVMELSPAERMRPRDVRGPRMLRGARAHNPQVTSPKQVAALAAQDNHN